MGALLNERIENDFKGALKKRDAITVSALRMLKAALQNKAIEKRVGELPDGEILKVMAKQVEQYQDSIAQFTKGQRPDLVEKETQQLAVIKRYLPEQLSQEEIAKAVREIIRDSGGREGLDFGRVMKLAMAKLSGKAEGKLVGQIVTAELANRQ